MKKWIVLIGTLAAVGILTRLPHPAKDISKLKPVRVVYLHVDGGDLCIETDTGDTGSGRDLTEAAADLRAGSDGEIFLDTAEFLLLDTKVNITQEFYELLRPGCKLCITDRFPDMMAAADFLEMHPPEITLAHLRAMRIPEP